MMNSNILLDKAFFQLSPRRTRCELFVTADGKTEKLASGFLKPFVTHLKIAEEQSSHAVNLINLEVGGRKNAATWFNKGTVERFVRFVSTPEVLELLSTLDAEMTQLEGARQMYSQGAGHQFAGGNENKYDKATDATKKELIRAIDVRISAVKQDLATACARASAAGFNLEAMSDLLLFANQFGAFRLSSACKDFHSLSQRRPELISLKHSLTLPDIHSQWRNFKDSNVHSSSGSDMSIDEPVIVQTDSVRQASYCSDAQLHHFGTHQQKQQAVGKPASATIDQVRLEDSLHFVGKDMGKLEDDPAPCDVLSSSEPALQAGGISRRLSVQDRINLFESKKKEQSGNVGGNFGVTTATRLAGAKGEHRMNPPDLSAEKLVLRRWSGASDMSIDLSSNSSSSIDRKENGSTAGTPTSANSHFQINRINSEIAGSSLKEYPRLSSQNCLVSNSSTSSSYPDQEGLFLQDEFHASHKEGIASTSKELPGLAKGNIQANTWRHSSSSFANSGGSVISREPGITQASSRTASEDLVNDHMVSEVSPRSSLALEVPSEQNDHASLLAQNGQSTSNMEGVGARSKHASDSQIHFTVSMEKLEDISLNGDSVHPEAIVHDFYEEVEETEQKSLAVTKLQSKGFSAKAQQGSVSQGLKFPDKASGTDNRKRFQGRTDDMQLAEGNNVPPFQSRKINEGTEAPPLSLEESQTSKKNTDTELSDALQLKTEEMERFFDEHKHNNHGDQTVTSGRRKASADHEPNSLEKRHVRTPQQKPKKVLLGQGSSNGLEFDFDLSGMIESFGLSNIRQEIGNHTPSDLPRGELYGKYMVKRDAKLNQICDSKRAQKDAKMKEMLDRLELSQVELRRRFASFNIQKNADAHLLAEKMKSFNLHSTIRDKEQTSESLIGDVVDVDLELCGSSSGNRFKKILSNRPVPSTSLTSGSLNHLVKSANSNSLGHRGQTENPAVQSIPAFSITKNENMKPSMVVAKPRNFMRSKSFIDDMEISKDGRSCWSNPMRKSSATTELKDLSLNSEKCFHKVQIGTEIRQYLKKGNGVKHDSGTVSGKRISETPEELKNNDGFEVVSDKEDSSDMAVEDLQRAYVDGNNMDPHIDSDGGKPRHSQESCGHESECGDLMRTLSQRDDSRTIFSKFNSPRNADDSAEASFGSLNSHVYHSCAYGREMSDIYTSLNSPTDSSSWISHSVSHVMDSEATRMRKKWGNAQIPDIASNASQQPRRDVTKGFKRLLKFGRKGRGTDYLINDWVSASTASEGDDDPEDGRDFVQRPSDDFRKSRMGCNVTYDGYNDIFPEQAPSLHNSIPKPRTNYRLRDDNVSGSSFKAPRSFFSLPSFRSKAGR